MDIVPIQLSLTAGDLITLWAPSWREDGEEWEGFLGDEDAVHAFPDAAMLTAYVRCTAEHDLVEHPAWPLVPQLSAPDLVPTEDQCYDVIGVPEIVASEPDSWAVGELAGITAIVRALADTCGLDTVHDVLGSTEAFALLEKGAWAFSGREGGKLWLRLAEVIADRWDEVIDALDRAIQVPKVDRDQVALAGKELVEAATDDQPGPSTGQARPARAADRDTDQPGAHLDAADEFWQEVGIDPILISLDDGDCYTLRSYLDDRAVFLGTAGRIQALPSTGALARHLTKSEGRAGHDLTRATTWAQVVAKAEQGTLQVTVDPQNSYRLTGLDEGLAAGPATVDPHQLDLAVELLLDVGQWAEDDAARVALSRSRSLGGLTSFVLEPDLNRLAPSPPFDAAVAQWKELVNALAKRLRRR